MRAFFNRLRPRRSSERIMPSLRFARPVAIAFALMLIGLIAALAYKQYHLRLVDDHALDISKNAAPSVDVLLLLGNELQQLRGLADESLDDAHGDALRAQMHEKRANIGKVLLAYEATPFFPGEVELFADLLRDLAQLDDAVLAAQRHSILHADLQRSFERVDQTVTRLKAFNMGYAKLRADTIYELMRQSTLLALLLGAGAFVIAVIASATALHMVRMQARLMEHHGQLLVERASELEAFSGRVAHDLRNPLGTIALRLDALAEREALEPELRASLERVRAPVGRMHRLIDGLLEFATAGARATQGARANLKEIIDGAVADARPGAEAAHAELDVDDRAAALEVACSSGALASVVSNLLGNAIKYIVEASSGVRRIWVRVRKKTNAVRVETEDTGPGLPRGAEREVFEPFRRMSSTKQPGFGLGLATVKKIVEAYGGQVGVSSELGRGSTFWFELPLT